MNGANYYPSLPPVQQAHSTTAHESSVTAAQALAGAPGSVVASVAGLPPGMPASLARLPNSPAMAAAAAAAQKDNAD